MATPEELSILFNQNLSLTPQTTAQQTPAPIPTPSPTSPPSQSIKYSISGHYHHSAHQALSPSPESSRTMTLLKLHGIDPSSIPSYKLAVFESVDPEDRAELIELWKRADSSLATSVLPVEFAKRTPEEYTQQNYSGSDPNTTRLLPKTGEGDDRQHHQQSTAEPYIIAGYEESSSMPVETFSPLGTAVGKPNRSNNWGYEYNRATDPVYAEARDDGEQRLAYQYGAYEHMREYAGRAVSEPAHVREGNGQEDTEMGD